MHFRLLTKYTLAIGSVVLLAIGPFAFLNGRTLRTHLMEEAVRDVDFLSETLIEATHYQMLEDDRKRVYQMISEVGNQQGVEHIRLINKDGIIAFSTDPSEIGTVVDKKAASCTVCHSANIPLVEATSMSRSRIFQDDSEREVLGLARGIYNEPACFTAECHEHTRGSRLLGVLDVIVSLETVKTNLAEYRRSVAWLAFGLLLLVGLALTLLTQTLISAPLLRLLRHTERVGDGDLDSRIQVESKDEVGQLGVAFNRMTAHLQETQGELRNLMQDLESKVAARTREIEEIQSRLSHSEKLASLGALVAGIAHEINNPLTSIVMFSSMALGQSGLNPSLRSDLETVLSETQRCADIVRRLLEFSRESPPCKEYSDVNTLLDQTFALLEHQALFHNVLTRRRYSADLPEIFIDPNQIRQVLINILVNAGQAMDGNGELVLATEQREKWVAIEVTDSGCGIPEENLTKIFDPFFTTKEHVGTGLGLSVSYGIVQNHGGKITVESRVGEGTRFVILLPIRPAEEDVSA
ncbi:ATP-binding protein [Desulfuromonas carbonis]